MYPKQAEVPQSFPPPPDYHPEAVALNPAPQARVLPSPETDPRYRCCYGSGWHVRNCANLIGIYEFVISLIGLSVLIVIWMTRESIMITEIIIVTICAITLLVTILLFIGIKTTKPQLLIPYMIWQIIQVVILIIICVIYAIAIGIITALLIMIGLSAAMLAKAYFVTQVKGCYEYLKEKNIPGSSRLV